MANVEIIKLGHAFHKGERGSKEGGAPSKDSIWGFAFVGGALVKFFGRRGGKLRFKAEKKADLPACIEQFTGEKITGYPFGKNLDCRYTEIDPAKADTVVEGLKESISKHYYAAVKAGTINKRSTQKAEKAEDAPKAAKPAKAKTTNTNTNTAAPKTDSKGKRKPATTVPAGYGSDSAEAAGATASA